jgi:hypothetical protein
VERFWNRGKKRSGIAFEAKNREGRPLFLGCDSTKHQSRLVATLAAVREAVSRAN